MADNKVGVFSFRETIQGEMVHFNVLKLKESFMLWIGTEPNMKSLSLAMKNRTGSDVISSQLLGQSTDVASTAVAQRLVPIHLQPPKRGQPPYKGRNSWSQKCPLFEAKRTGVQCFVSISLPNPALLSQAETIIVTKLQSNPSQFYLT